MQRRLQESQKSHASLSNRTHSLETKVADLNAKATIFKAAISEKSQLIGQLEKQIRSYQAHIQKAEARHTQHAKELEEFKQHRLAQDRLQRKELNLLETLSKCESNLQVSPLLDTFQPMSLGPSSSEPQISLLSFAAMCFDPSSLDLPFHNAGDLSSWQKLHASAEAWGTMLAYLPDPAFSF